MMIRQQREEPELQEQVSQSVVCTLRVTWIRIQGLPASTPHGRAHHTCTYRAHHLYLYLGLHLVPRGKFAMIHAYHAWRH